MKALRQVDSTHYAWVVTGMVCWSRPLALAPAFLCIFYLRHHRRATRWQEVCDKQHSPSEAPVIDSSRLLPSHDPWHVHRARKNVTKAILVSRWNYQKVNKHSPSPIKKQIWVKTNLEKKTNPHANRNKKYFYTLCTSAEQRWERGKVTQGLSSQKNDSCDRFVLITQNKPLLLFIKEEQIHQCLLIEKVIAIRMVMTRMTARMTTRMRFWMILRNIPVRTLELLPKLASVSRSLSRALCIFSLSWLRFSNISWPICSVSTAIWYPASSLRDDLSSLSVLSSRCALWLSEEFPSSPRSSLRTSSL